MIGIDIKILFELIFGSIAIYLSKLSNQKNCKCWKELDRAKWGVRRPHMLNEYFWEKERERDWFSDPLLIVSILRSSIDHINSQFYISAPWRARRLISRHYDSIRLDFYDQGSSKTLVQFFHLSFREHRIS